MARVYKKRPAYGSRTRRLRYAAQTRSRASRFTRNRNYRTRRTRTLRMFRNPMASSRVKTTLRYCTNIQLDPKPEALGVTGSNLWQFGANGLYDPDITGTGHQPMYFDNYAALYRQYRVTRSKISVTVVNTSVNTATTGPVLQPNYSYRLFILADGSNGLTNEYPANMGDQIEEGGPNLKWRFVAPSLTGRLAKLKNQCVPYKLCNLGYKDDTLDALTTTNPAQSCYYYIGITSSDGVTDPPSVYLYVTITYYVEFFDHQNIQTQN